MKLKKKQVHHSDSLRGTLYTRRHKRLSVLNSGTLKLWLIDMHRYQHYYMYTAFICLEKQLQHKSFQIWSINWAESSWSPAAGKLRSYCRRNHSANSTLTLLRYSAWVIYINTRMRININRQCNNCCSDGMFSVYVLFRLVIGTEESNAVYQVLVT